ncbi:GFA family protein [Cellvibrio sp. KY-GH-1]|nr:GFA family protein [Cellvibrio sp. KY-GH-1]
MGVMIGKCLCEAVEYTIDGALGPVYNCHCSKCRRWHGAAFRTRASINKNQFTWIKGEANLSSYKSSDYVTKFFCKTCGSPLISTYDNKPDILGVPLGGIEGIEHVEVQAHIFVGSKASWYEIADLAPQYDAWPGSEEAVRETNQ